MQKWEYAEISLTWGTGDALREFSYGVVGFSHDEEKVEFLHDDIRSILRRMGENGWELVSVARSVIGDLNDSLPTQDIFFKRPLED